MGLFRDMAKIPGEIASGAVRALTTPPRWSSGPAPRSQYQNGPLWPRPGAPRIRGTDTELWYHGWQTPRRAESRTTTSMVPNLDYARAQAARHARAARPGHKPPTGRSPR